MKVRPVWPVVVIGTLAVLTVDTTGSIVSELFDLPYQWFAIPSFVSYAATGFVAGRRHSIAAAAYAGLALAVVDATLGWWVSWQIGAGRTELEEPHDFLALVLIGKLSIALNTLFALGAGIVGRRLTLRRRHSSQRL